MGLFDSKEETVVGTSVTRLLKDYQVPDAIRTALVEAIYKDQDYVDSVLEAVPTTMSSKFEKAYRYANKGTPYGMPSGEIYSNNQGYEEAKKILGELEGSPVTVEYIQFGGTNLIHMAWMDLIETFGYSPQTNKIGALSQQQGKEIYLVDMYVEMSSATFANYSDRELSILGKAPNVGYTPVRPIGNPYYTKASEVGIVEVLAVPRVVVKYGYMPTAPGSSFQVQNLYMPLRQFDALGDYYHVKYQTDTEIKYWAYLHKSGGHPSLDAVFDTSEAVLGDFYPSIYYRLNKQNIGADTSSTRYKTSAKLSKYLGIDFETINTAIHENPDIGNVQQAFLTYGIPAESDDQGDLKYLFDFFDRLHSVTPVFEDDLTHKRSGGIAGFMKFVANLKTITIRDNVFEMNLVYDRIVKTRKPGVIGKVGHLTRENTGSGRFSFRYYRKQISQNFYEEIEVSNMIMKYTIEGGNMTVLGDNGTEEILLIPLDRTIVRTYGVREAERICARSLHLVCNSLVVVEIAWYAQSWFVALVQIAAVVATIIAAGSDGGQFLAAAAALTGASYGQLVMIILKELLIYFIVREALKLFVKLVGVEIAFIAAVIAAAYGIQQSATVGLQATTTIGLSAQSLIQLASGIASAIGSEVNSLTNELKTQATTFNKEKEEKLELLDSVSNELYSGNLLKPFVILGESPKTFYKRTVHSGNIGVLVFDDIHSYVSRSLQLPSFSDTLGGISYGL